MNVSRLLSVAALCAVLVPGAVLARSKNEDIYNATIPLETKAKPDQIKKGVKMAVLNRKWTISNEKGNSFDATYTKPERRGDLTAVIHVTYGPKEVKIEHVKTENMDEEGGQVNRYYNSWVKNLEKDIPIYIEREVVASE